MESSGRPTPPIGAQLVYRIMSLEFCAIIIISGVLYRDRRNAFIDSSSGDGVHDRR
jgi:hypothetical protein